MNIIIVGCGRLGSTLANDLSNAGHNISIIDRDNERLNVLGSGYNGTKIKGIEFDNDILLEAGISNTDVILSVTPDDNINITVSLIAQTIYKVPRIIARIVNPNRKSLYEKLEIETISPTQLGADILKAKLAVKSAETIAVIDKDYEVIEIIANKTKGYSVEKTEEKYSCIISAIIREEVLILPTKNELIHQGEKIICTINKRDKDRLISSL